MVKKTSNRILTPFVYFCFQNASCDRLNQGHRHPLKMRVTSSRKTDTHGTIIWRTVHSAPIVVYCYICVSTTSEWL